MFVSVALDHLLVGCGGVSLQSISFPLLFSLNPLTAIFAAVKTEEKILRSKMQWRFS